MRCMFTVMRQIYSYTVFISHPDSNTHTNNTEGGRHNVYFYFSLVQPYLSDIGIFFTHSTHVHLHTDTDFNTFISVCTYIYTYIQADLLTSVCI